MKSYWPGGDGHWTTAPKYPRLILIVDNIAPLDWAHWRRSRDKAIDWWLACKADIRLSVTHSKEAFSPGTITFYENEDTGPYGWYDPEGRYGYVSMARGDQDAPTVAHEIGHALGFGHTGIKDSIMSQWNIWTRDGVGKVDARGLRRYYGGK